MLVPTGLGHYLSLLYTCTLLYEVTSTPITASPALQVPQSPLPTNIAALGNSSTLIFNQSYGITLPSTFKNLASNRWPHAPFSIRIPGFASDCRLQFSETQREGNVPQGSVLLDMIYKQVVQWHIEEGTYPSWFSSAFRSLKIATRWPKVRIFSLPLRNDEDEFLNLAD